MISVRDLLVLCAGGGCWRQLTAEGLGWDHIKGGWVLVTSIPHTVRLVVLTTETAGKSLKVKDSFFLFCVWRTNCTVVMFKKLCCMFQGELFSRFIVFSRFSSARFSDAGVLCIFLRVTHLLRNSIRDHRLSHRGKQCSFRHSSTILPK